MKKHFHLMACPKEAKRPENTHLVLGQGDHLDISYFDSAELNLIRPE
jgi:protein involved in polysaccharide export with SLBB domain